MLPLIKLSSSKLRSWSIAISVGLEEKRAELKLQTFKKSIKLRNNTFAFAMVPFQDSEEVNLDKTKIFRELFPTLELISFYHNNLTPAYSINSDDSSKLRLKIKV